MFRLLGSLCHRQQCLRIHCSLDKCLCLVLLYVSFHTESLNSSNSTTVWWIFDIYFTIRKLEGVYTSILVYKNCMKALNPVRLSDALHRSEILWELLSLSTWVEFMCITLFGFYGRENVTLRKSLPWRVNVQCVYRGRLDRGVALFPQ
jgi:hypothetical protein